MVDEKMRRKICHLTCSHGVYDVRIFQKECVSLVRAGYDVTCIGLNDKDDIVEGVRVLGISKPRKMLGRVTIDLLTRKTVQLLRLGLQEKADLYHFHDPHLIPAGLILKFFGKRVVYDVHEYQPGVFAAQFQSVRMRRAVTAIVDWCQCLSARALDGVVAATPFIHEQFKRRGIHSIVANNFPLLSEIGIDPVKVPQPSTTPLVAYIGLISRIRGIVPTIHALEYTDAGLILCGRFATDELQRECENLPGWKKVQYLGYVDRARTAEVLGSVRAGLVPFLPHPNHFEARPNKIFEYMGAGLPVIASHFPDWKELIERNRCGMCVDPTDPISLGGAIQKVIDEPLAAREMGERGRGLAQAKFNWGVEEKVLEAFYDKILLPSQSCGVPRETTLRV